MDAFLAIQIVALGLGLIQNVGQELNSMVANNIRSEYAEEIKTITKSLNADSTLLNDLQNAYNNQNTKLFTKLALASPIGAGYAHIKNLIKKKEKEHSEATRVVSDRISEKQNLLDKASRLSDRASYSVADNVRAHTQLGDIKDKVTTITNQEQNILGGLKDA